MISLKGRESRRGRIYKMSRNLERLYKEGKCRECKVLVTRMDFAKILGKFTKVKIQYESSSSPKTKKNIDSNLSNSNSRLKCNENGMVFVRKNASKKQSKVSEIPKRSEMKESITGASELNQVSPTSNTPLKSNILKENNGVKKKLLVKEKTSNYIKKTLNSDLKQYGIVFTAPTISNNNNEIKSKLTLIDLLPNLNKSILPSEEWCIDFFPKNEEPKDDKVYDRIAAELEDLMYNEKPIEKLKSDLTEIKVEEFPSIMDILNDNTSDNNCKENEDENPEPFKTNIESNDVEAILLGKSNIENKDSEPIPMEVDNTDVSKLMEVMDQLHNITDGSKLKVLNEEATDKPEVNKTEELENPHSPSVLDEALKKGIEEHLPNENQQTEMSTEVSIVHAESEDNKINKTIPENIETNPNNIEMISENNEVVSDNNDLISENNDIIPESNKIVSENNEIIPENSETIPENSETITENSETITENSETITEITKTIPEKTATVPENIKTVPENIETVPENNETISDSNDIITVKNEIIANNEETDGAKAVMLVDNNCEDISITQTNEHKDSDSITISNSAEITHVVFKKVLNGKCCKSVTCPKNLKYSIELEGKSVEFIGAPKYILSLEDLQVLLQIVNESELGSLYVFH
ncbi:putative leucine-rich repeat-containing protein DDB_G0290503 [Battus philenor]|uniref:putative leucine-rich repeat-containing protein DDB_G0290503 n=1 Tax=Battus philenor TaxID=42288 RepID=UPI0035D0074B